MKLTTLMAAALIVCSSARAVMVPVDLPVDRRLSGETDFRFDGMNGMELGETLDLDLAFGDAWLHLFSYTGRHIMLVLMLETTDRPWGAGGFAFWSPLAEIGPNGGYTGVTTPGPLDLHTVHFPNVTLYGNGQITGGFLRVAPDHQSALADRFDVFPHVPEGGSGLLILGIGLAAIWISVLSERRQLS